MAVVVDPLRLDLHHRGQKWRGPEQHIVAGGNNRHQSSSFARFRSLDPLYILCHGLPPGGHRVGLTITNNLKRPEPQALAATVEALAARFGNRLITSRAAREQHAHTTTWLASQPPDAVVMAQETSDIQDTVRICAKYGVPVIAFGTGTSLEGQVNAPAGGVCIDLRDMSRVLEVHAEDLDCVIQPGVTRKALNEHLRDQGLFFPIDPGADASLGGMASTRASGTNAVRYGTMRDNVLALKVVRGDGEIITTGTRAKKSSAGYDLTHLFVGAEGTLGIISELTIKLRGVPETIAAAACSFESVRGACQATILAIQTGIPVARIELLNAAQVQACNSYSKLSLPETPLLLLEFHGSASEVAEQSENFSEIAKECGGGDFTWTTRPEDRTKLWQARHDAYWAVKALRPGAGVVETEADLKRLNLLSPIVGHVGDGNFHCSLACDVDDHEEMARGEEFMHRLVERAQAMGGTCTGEHGIGQGKQKYLKAEFGPEALDAMRALKQALDPQNIFNPGKIVPAA